MTSGTPVMSNQSLAEHSASPGKGVIIVGAGPIGLLLANLLGSLNILTEVFERRAAPLASSMAIGVTPPSLEILKRLNLDQVFSTTGVQVRYAEVYESGRKLGRLSFDHIHSEYPFFLSIPQAQTVQILRESLRRFWSVRLHDGLECTGLQQNASNVQVDLRDSRTGITHRVCGAFVIGCDGHRSAVRTAIGLSVRERDYPQRFVMADFEDNSGLKAEARLFFSAAGSVESFPLPGGWRRWIVLSSGSRHAAPLSYLIGAVRRLTGYDLSRQSARSLSEFGAKRMVVERYYTGRVVLAGDAAHVMSSVGGQGMNTGFADAEFLAALLPAALRTPGRIPECFATYDRLRRRACVVAANRAERGMWLGTRRGRLASALRKFFIAGVLFSPACRPRLAPHFAMLTIPFRNLEHVPPELLVST